jgi:uncharacterized membrane protein
MSLDAIAPPLDLAALAYFALVLAIYRVIVVRRTQAGGGLLGAIQKQRVSWMLNMAQREQRMLDAILLGSLGQGNAFFASTSAIAVGGLAATLGSGERLQAMLAHLPYVAPATPGLWEAKQILIMSIFVYAFFKFAWAFRISHYASIMIGATPPHDAASSEGMQHAERTAALIGVAAEHTNSGLRSYYHAIATLAWFFHPLLFMAATTWVVLILARRDFFSRTLRLVSTPVAPR